MTPKPLMHLVLLCLVVGLAVGCSKPIDVENLKEMGGLMYAPNEDKPFTGRAFRLHKNGQKAAEGEYKEGRRQGSWVEWHDNGHKSGDGQYLNGTKGGQWTFWNLWGAHDWSGEYHTYDVENLKEMGGLMYAPNEDKPFTGRAFRLHKNGQKEREGEFKKGKRHGNWRWWSESGHKTRDGEFKKGKRHGNWRWWSEWWSESRHKTKEVEYNYGKEQRESIWWSESAHKMRESEFRDGKVHKTTNWHANGQKERESEFRDGKVHKTTNWHANGQKDWAGEFKAGVIMPTYWDQSGKKRSGPSCLDTRFREVVCPQLAYFERWRRNPQFRLTGQVDLSEGTSFQGSGVLWIIAFARAAKEGPPVAVKKLPAGPFPKAFIIDAADGFLGGAVPEEVTLSAWVTVDGDIGSRHVLIAAPIDVAVGSSEVQLLLRRNDAP